MKKRTLLWIGLLLFPALNFAQNVTIPDANFKAELLANTSINTNGDTEIQLTEAQAFSGAINVDGKNITDLTGIETFVLLENLSCNNNQLIALDLSTNTALRTLYCYNNQLTTLDVSGNATLMWLWCNNNQLTTLDVSTNTGLTNLYCQRNQLTALDVTLNTSLTRLQCSNNQLMTLDVSQNTNLTHLHGSNNQLSILDISNNLALTTLGVSGNQLATLDVSLNTLLTSLDCSANQLTVLDVITNTLLTYLSCFNNQLSVLDVSNNTALTGLMCSDNQLMALDVSMNAALVTFWCSNNQLTALDVSNNLGLSSLICSGNQLSALDFSLNVALTTLWCDNNQLISLNVQNGTNTNITSFVARSNPNLLCIQVDDPVYSTTNWTNINNTTSYGTSCNTLLAVNALDFEGKAINGGIRLDWRGQNEVEVAYYILERSINGIVFEYLLQQGTEMEGDQYKHWDTQPYNGTNYYRLKQVNLDGTVLYSSIIAVDYQSAQQWRMTLAPNPVEDQLRIDCNGFNEGEVALEIYTTNGNKLYSNSNWSPKNSPLVVAVNNYPSGLYFLKIKQGNNTYIRHFVKH
ncbi:T9SS type A sorting domain-containing protein [Aureispira anguillae]|uniref:T9SS type A sorting domain-containing protein n=1 Tax=Aureispira anguillae TaxID=2864201 RepID=A0A915YFF7_9BACT|nr:T9SS type A sorting domain-containing protein [Aureispira anguillae]BDS12016.1 T9SS type A sorting domain-containing protein [Aureispira anguillae]